MSTGTAPLREQAAVIENRCEGGPNHRLVLRVAARWPGFAPGQFLMLSPGPTGRAPRHDPLLPRPMAIFRTRADRPATLLEILYKVTGRGTALLASARPGDEVRIVGPLGEGFPLPDGGRAVLVGGGTGIASLYELAARAARAASVQVLLGARSASELMGKADFAGLDLELRLATEDGSEGSRGLVTDALDELLAADGRCTVYACGPTPMMERAAQIARARGVRCLVSLENTMACGFGVCLGCAVPRAQGGFALVCRDGPVQDAEQVDWSGLA